MKTKAKSKTKTKSKARAQSKTKAAKPNHDFEMVNKRLEAIMRKYERNGLKNTPNLMANYCLLGPKTPTSNGREVWFGAVGTRKNYVSYHLMPVYRFPELLKGISPELKKRMQGKACFNFKEVDEKLFAELARLTEEGYKRFKAEKLVR